MLNKDVPVKYKRYNGKDFVLKNIRFDKVTAENINKTIAVFNNKEKVLKLNNDVLINLAVKEFLNDNDIEDIKDLIRSNL